MLSKEYRQDRKELVEEKKEWKDNSKEAIDIAKNDSTFTDGDVKGLKKYCNEKKKKKNDKIKSNRKTERQWVMYKVKRPFVRLAYKIGLKKGKVRSSGGGGGGGRYNLDGKYKEKYTYEQRLKYDSLMREIQNLNLEDHDGDGVPDYEDSVVMYNDVTVEPDNIIIYEDYAPYEDEAFIVAEGQGIGEESYHRAGMPDYSNISIVDNTDNNSSKGTIAYSVPKEMQVGKSYQIKLRITKEKGKEVNKTLVIGEREISIADPSIDSRVTIENIRVERTMTAQLLSEDDAFKVTPLNTDKQVIEDGEYTEWGWVISPLKSGKTYLKLIIKIKIEADGEINYKDIVVFDKNIEVKANVSLGVKSWFSEYWQWLMTTIIIPLVVFFYKKRKKDKEEK
jgi:hypothetical protein